MKRSNLAVLAAALAAASTGAIAAAGDTWRGSSRDTVVITTPGEEVVRVYNDPYYVDGDRVVYQERIAGPVIERPIVVERDYVIYEPAYAVVPREAYFDPLHPELGQGIGTGLFNRKGPNDFGA